MSARELAHSDECVVCRRRRRERREACLRAIWPWLAVIAFCVVLAAANGLVEAVSP